jgi:hypothetical protein
MNPFFFVLISAGIFSFSHFAHSQSRMTLDFSNLTVIDSYERDPQSGIFRSVHTQISATHSKSNNQQLQTTAYVNKHTEHLQGDPFKSIQIYRRGNYAELQIYTLNLDDTGIVTPDRINLPIRLVGKNTWQKYESGREVEAEFITDSSEARDNENRYLEKYFAELSEDFVMLMHISELEAQAAQMNSTLGDMQTTVRKFSPRKIKLSLNKMTVTYSGADTSVTIDLVPQTAAPKDPRPAPPQKP